MDHLSVYKQDQLDLPTKSFEVAFRSYVAQHILTAYPEKEDLQKELQNQVEVLGKSTAVLAARIKGTLKDYLTGRKWNAFWENLKFMKECNDEQRHVASHDVFYLSLSVTLTYTFKDLFQELIRQFPDITDYLGKSKAYCDVRNELSHRGSEWVSPKQADDAIDFICKDPRTGG